MRCAAYTAATNQYASSTHALAAIIHGKSKSSALHAPKDDPGHDSTAVAHFYDKLLHIKERLKTEPAKKLAEKRHQLVRFPFRNAQEHI